MRNLIILLIFSVITLNCCNKNNKSESIIKFKKFPKIVFLKNGRSLDLDMVVKMGFLYDLNKYLIIHDLYSTDKGIFILDKKTLTIKRKTGKIGRGPGEIGRYGNIYTDLSKNSYYVADFGKNKIWKYNIDSVIKMNNYLPKEQSDFIMLPGIYPYDFIIKRDTLFFMTELDYFIAKIFEKDSINFLSKNKKEIVGLDNVVGYNRTYSTRMTNMHDYSKYAFAFRYSEIISITDSSFVPIISVYGKGKSFYGEDKFKDILYYSHLKSDDVFLYGGYMNKPLIEKDENYGNHKANFPQTIRIFTWEGKPIVELMCNDPFSDFYIDRDNNRVILYLTNKKTPIHVYDVDFKELLK